MLSLVCILNVIYYFISVQFNPLSTTLPGIEKNGQDPWSGFKHGT